MSILTINNADPGVQRPFRLEDLQNVWEALNQIMSAKANYENGVRILSGFELDTAEGLWGPGVVSYNGQLYYFDAVSESISEGIEVFAARVPSGDLRRFANGTQQQFSFKNVITAVASTPGAVSLGNFTSLLVDLYKAPYIPDNFITGDKVEDGSITTAKLAFDAVTREKIVSQAVGGLEIVNGALPCWNMNAQQYTPTTQTGSINLLSLLRRDTTSGVYTIPGLYINTTNVPTSLYAASLELSGNISTVFPRLIPLIVVNTGSKPTAVHFVSNGYVFPMTTSNIPQGGVASFSIFRHINPGTSYPSYVPTGPAVIGSIN